MAVTEKRGEERLPNGGLLVVHVHRMLADLKLDSVLYNGRELVFVTVLLQLENPRASIEKRLH